MYLIKLLRLSRHDAAHAIVATGHQPVSDWQANHTEHKLAVNEFLSLACCLSLGLESDEGSSNQ